ncbi:hypothetical protein PLICRDRAFT_50150 [Plicaturopsis crispa FD-325 SS-3]|nr:hypothetical protein PLICRDRAFT_50150 [Plicaturopsis crispa FD-325 SS-3]
MDLRSLVFVEHPTSILIGASFVLALVALGPTPSALSLAFLLTIIQLYLRIIIPRDGTFPRALLLWVALTAAITLAHVGPSLHALSSAGTSIAGLAIISAVLSFFALAAIYLDARLCMRMKSPWAQLTLFPAIWATLWCGISTISPLGRLVTWSPVLGLGEYGWLAAYTGRMGIDWVVAALAVVYTHAAGSWFMGEEQDKLDDEPLIPHALPEDYRVSQKQAAVAKSRHALALAAILLALTIPSYVLNDLPVAVSSKDTTPLTVGCVLPSPIYSKQSDSSYLDEYIATSKKMTSAHVILWPEGAVRFDNARAREAALDRVRKEVHGPHVGVAFEEFIPADAGHDDGRVGKKRNGLALVGPTGTVMTYFKRNLVPVAESFSFTPSTEPPTIFDLNLSAPKGVNKTDWNPDTPHTRPIALTSSICLDFSSPSIFKDLPSRPALILAPGRTWHSAVGLAMWEQAKARAAELDSAVLWCDGGEGGVSGVAGRGMHDIMQVGDGYWVRTIGIPWPHDERRSFYARTSDMTLLVIIWAILEGGRLGSLLTLGAIKIKTVGKGAEVWIQEKFGVVQETVERFRRRGQTGERQSLL